MNHLLMGLQGFPGDVPQCLMSKQEANDWVDRINKFLGDSDIAMYVWMVPSNDGSYQIMLWELDT